MDVLNVRWLFRMNLASESIQLANISLTPKVYEYPYELWLEISSASITGMVFSFLLDLNSVDPKATMHRAKKPKLQ